ncbi:MAG TPA: NADP-dependent oxidoreductase [Chthoniobacterales bacterium]|jgi:NADPH:quinone reductase-like Zn-dependent oxidoreductase|nr:NADP-dependent oxidoreductase [Chthoniobacterales bacterium]
MNAKIILISAGLLAVTTFARSETMKAIVAHEYGGPEVLKLEAVPVPTPKEDEMLVKVVAAGVNSFDGVLRAGKFAKPNGTQLPWHPGYDIAGTVEKVGGKVTKFKVGDAVCAFITILKGGAYAEYALAKQTDAALKPATISFVEAAGAPSVALTAWQAIVDKANVQSGQTVLIHGASGGVGLFAIPIAKIRGAKVFATASTANQDFLKQLGADVAIDYKTQKFEDIAKDVDVVIDGVGGETLARSYPIVKKGGIIVSLTDRVDQAQLDKYGIRGASLVVQNNGDELAQIGKLIDEKKIKVIVSETFLLADAAKAQEKADTGHARGKIVLKVRDEPK